MQLFLGRFGSLVTGVLNGFDRLVLRGTLRSVVHGPRMMAYLSRVNVLRKDFAGWAKERCQQIKAAAEQAAADQDRPQQYLQSAAISKEDLARSIAQRDQVTQGLVTVLRAVEPCMSYEVHCNRAAKTIDIRSRPRRCMHLYYYLMHPQFGFMHVRLQTWAPYDIRVCLNGREWLARQLDAAGIGYRRHDNCFLHSDDFAAAQTLMNQQLTVDWPPLLDELARQVNPIYAPDFEALGLKYYWSAYQSEWASDLAFRSPAALAQLYPRLLHHGMTTFASGDVLRFLGRRVCADGRVHPNFRAEITSDLKVRPEGVRLKHRVGANSIKLYDKEGSVLRIETTINDPCDFKVYRTPTGADDRPPAWLEMRKTVADLPRRAEVSQKSNERYADGLATINDTTPLHELTDPLCCPTRWHKQRVRALNPLAPDDVALLAAIVRGEFLVNGLRNRDLCALLYPTPTDDQPEQRRRSAAVTRKLRMLRAHGLLHKVPHTHRYMVSPKGQKSITALLAARQADTQLLTQQAA